MAEQISRHRAPESAFEWCAKSRRLKAHEDLLNFHIRCRSVQQRPQSPMDASMYIDDVLPCQVDAIKMLDPFLVDEIQLIEQVQDRR